MGNHNFLECAFLDAFQKPREPLSFVFEPTTHVAVDLVAGVQFPEALDLPFQVVRLLAGGDPAIDGAFRFLGTGWLGSSS